MKYINLFPTQASYDAADKYYPNVSYIEGTDEVKYMETDPTLIVAKFTTRSANQNVIITYYQQLFSSIIIDGEPLTIGTGTLNHTFASAGEHEVECRTVDTTTIGNNAFSSCSNLTSITIPNSVTSIGESAFKRCNYLAEITIPDSVTSIGREAFSNCTRLTSVIIPDSVTTIGNFAFQSCTGLTTITIGNSVTSIAYSAFSGCSGLTGELTIPNSVTEIQSNAFSGCSGLTSVDLGSVTSIGENAFGYCSGLTSITIPNTVTSIGEKIFSNCSGLASIVVESGNTKYDSRDNCNAIIETATNTLITTCTSSVIPSTVTIIGQSAFYGRTDLTSFIIPNSVTYIKDYAFGYCTNLVSITIPDSVTRIGYSGNSDVFPNCNALASFTCLGTTPPVLGNYQYPLRGVPADCPIYVPAASVDAYKAANGWSGRAAYIQAIPAPVSTTITATFTTSSPNMSVCIANKQQLFSEITVEGSQQTIGTNRMNYTFATAGDHVVTYTAVDTTAIGMDAFDDCRGLTSIIIPNSVTSIEDEAFKECYDLVSITLPDSLITIGEYTFSGTAITSLTIPEGVTTIGDDAFFECENLDNITLPSTLTSIGSGAFLSCTAITSMTCYATTPPTAGQDALTDIASDSPVFVPAASVSAYQSASGWSRLYIEPIQ